MKQSLRVFALLLALLSWPALAVVNGHKYHFDDAEQIARFQALNESLRCPKCQNQDLADSNSPVAGDMRDKIYELMQQGKTDEDIENYMVARYGDFVRYKPPFRADTWLLWLGPIGALLIGLLVVAMIRRGRPAVAPLTPEEQARLQALRAGAGSKNEEPKA